MVVNVRVVGFPDLLDSSEQQRAPADGMIVHAGVTDFSPFAASRFDLWVWGKVGGARRRFLRRCFGHRKPTEERLICDQRDRGSAVHAVRGRSSDRAADDRAADDRAGDDRAGVHRGVLVPWKQVGHRRLSDHRKRGVHPVDASRAIDRTIASNVAPTGASCNNTNFYAIACNWLTPFTGTIFGSIFYPGPSGFTPQLRPTAG
jgi:hypothetical protein